MRRVLSQIAFRVCLFLALYVGISITAFAEILDDVGGATAAYSLRRLDADYTGASAHAITVRRSSDDTTKDVGFDANGNLDTTALLAFVGTGANDHGYVVTWYDQTDASTSGLDVSTSDANQPRIVSGGTVVRAANGAPAVKFSGGQVLAASYTTTMTAQCTAFSVGQFLSLPSNLWTVDQRLWSLNVEGSTRLSTGGQAVTETLDDVRLAAVSGTPFGGKRSSFALNTTDAFLATMVADGTQADGQDTISLFANGGNVLQWTNASIDQDDNLLTIGSQTDDTSFGNLDGYLQELIFYGSLSVADRETVDGDLMQHYVPEPSSLVMVLLGLGLAAVCRFRKRAR